MKYSVATIYKCTPPAADDQRVFIVDTQKRFAEEQRKCTQCRTGNDRTQNASLQNAANALVFSCANILTHKGLCRLMKRIHGDIDKALNAAGGAAAGNYDAAIGVDSTLYGHIGETEQTALYAGGYPDFGHLYQTAPVDPQLSPGK